MAHKTPKKRKMDELFPSSPSNPYKKLMDENFAFSNENANGYAQHFDDSLNTLSNEVVKMTKAQSLLGHLLAGSSENANIRMDEITDLVGVKPPLLEGIFDAPHLWGTVGDLATMILDQPEVFNNNLESRVQIITAQFTNLLKEAKATSTFDLDQHYVSLEARIVKIKEVMVGVATAAKGGIEQNMGRIGALESSSFTKTHTSTDPGDFSRVYERLKILEQESA